MIATKVQKHPNKSINCPPSAETETTTSGIRASQDDISTCAYFLYQKRGGAHGHDAQDWAEAELLITQR